MYIHVYTYVCVYMATFHSHTVGLSLRILTLVKWKESPVVFFEVAKMNTELEGTEK